MPSIVDPVLNITLNNCVQLISDMERKSSIQNILSYIPITQWLPQYQLEFIRWDLLAGITLASFVLPESMAYAALAGLPTYYGIYSCIVGGFLFACFTSSKQLAVGPTSSISLMIASTISVLAMGNLNRWIELVALTALIVAGICFIAFIFKLSSLVNFVSESILLGFKAGAALSIISTQLPKLFSVEGGGKNFIERMYLLFQHLHQFNLAVLIFGAIALLLLLMGDKIFPSKPVSLLVVIASIIVLTFTKLTTYGFEVTGKIPSGLPSFSVPTFGFNDLESVFELAGACFLMGYTETISAARTLALKYNDLENPRQELLSMGFANLGTAFSSGYVVSGGLSQSIVNDASGAKTPVSLIVSSTVLTLILLFFTGLLKNLPEVILAVIVVHAVSRLINIKELKRTYLLSKTEFWVAIFALFSVLIFGILKGVMLSVLLSLALLIRRISYPHVAVLGRIGASNHFSDIEFHADNILVDNVLILRVEASILYFNAEDIQQKIHEKIDAHAGKIDLIILDLSSASNVDIAGSKMLLQLSDHLKLKGIRLRIVEALFDARNLLRKLGLETVIGHISRRVSINDAIADFFEVKSTDSSCE